MKVKVFKNRDIFNLENDINHWIERFANSYEVLDIKFSGSGNSAPYSTEEYTAMIIYKKNINS